MPRKSSIGAGLKARGGGKKVNPARVKRIKQGLRKALSGKAQGTVSKAVAKRKKFAAPKAGSRYGKKIG